MALETPALSPTVDVAASARSATGTSRALLFVGLSVLIFFASTVLLGAIMWYCWRRERQGVDPSFQLRRTELDIATQDSTVKKQVRLPIVIINPDDDVECALKDSGSFSAKPGLEEDVKEPALPDTPPSGSYYISGPPGYFEVYVELGAKQPLASPVGSSKSTKTTREMLNAAVARLSPMLSPRKRSSSDTARDSLSSSYSSARQPDPGKEDRAKEQS